MDQRIPHHGPHPRRILEHGAVVGHELGVGRRLQLLPRVARHQPALRRLLAQRVQVFRLPGQQGHHRPLLEQPARVAGADEACQVPAEQHVEDALRLRLLQRRHRRPGVQLAQRGPLLRGEHHVRPGMAHHLLEPLHRGLAVLVVRRHRHPALGRHLGRLLHQHRHLHVGGRAQPERVGVAALPHQRIRQGFPRDVQRLVLQCEVAERQPDVGQEPAGQQVRMAVPHQLPRQPHRGLRLAGIIPADHLQLAAQHPAGLVHLRHGELPAVAVGQGEGGDGGVAVDLPDPDGGPRIARARWRGWQGLLQTRAPLRAGCGGRWSCGGVLRGRRDARVGVGRCQLEALLPPPLWEGSRTSRLLHAPEQDVAALHKIPQRLAIRPGLLPLA